MFRIIFRVLLITTGFCIGVNSYSQIQEYKAKTVEPYKAKTIAPVTSTNQAKLNHDKIPNSESGNINFFIRKWKCGVSGAAYETKDIVNNKNTITTSTGTAKTKPLNINANGTYYWEAYGEKKSGKWERTGKTDYPIVLRKAVEGKDWLVGRDTHASTQIYIWDGNYYSYTAVPL